MIEGPVSPQELVEILQKAVEEQGSALINARLEEEEKRLSNQWLREEQDAAYQVALRTDQERDGRRRLETERAAREGKEKTKQENRPITEAAPRFEGRETARAGDTQPEKGPNVTQILIRFPNGDRKERRFLCTERVKSIYNYVDSLGLVGVGRYRLIATFPRRVYGSDKMHMTLKEAGLHPQASLYLELL